jgi:NAD(P)-dependent dehydrogenase (short-subunit alcohol dehydrogenase family)
MESIQGDAKVALVTGASDGIGREIAITLLEAGFRVILASRSEEKLRRVLTDNPNIIERAWIHPCDLTNPNQADQIVGAIMKREGHLDVLVNNLGKGLRKSVLETSDAEWDYLISINLSSAFFVCRSVLHEMRRQQNGNIINISSRAGRLGEGQFAGYCAAKHGLIGLTRALADSEAEYGIQVNAICPGPVATSQMVERYPDHERNGWSTPQGVARTVLYLLSPAASAMNGKVIDLFHR